MRDFIATFALGAAILILWIAAAFYAEARNNPPVLTSSIQWITCYEDEVIIWHDNAHSMCWPVDDIWMLQEVK